MKRFGLWAVLAVCMGNAWSFNLRPGTALDEQVIALKKSDFGEWILSDVSRSIIHRFSEPVHEIITNRAWGCAGKAADAEAEHDPCLPQAGDERFAPAAVLAGVQWNDNPYFQLVTTSLSQCQGRYVWLPAESVCWARVFKKGEKDARKGAKFSLQSGDVLLLRSHFGDLQFLHAMRSSAEETPAQTRDKVLMWAEFMWRAALGQYQRGSTIANANVAGLDRYFYPSDTMQRIFFRGNPTYVDDFPRFALGSLMHMVEDSFSKSHVLREAEGSSGQKCAGVDAYQPARIVSFQNYAEQDSHEHAASDTYVAMREGVLRDPANVLNVVGTLRQLYDKQAPWEEAGAYLRCVFEVLP